MPEKCPKNFSTSTQEFSGITRLKATTRRSSPPSRRHRRESRSSTASRTRSKPSRQKAVASDLCVPAQSGCAFPTRDENRAPTVRPTNEFPEILPLNIGRAAARLLRMLAAHVVKKVPLVAPSEGSESITSFRIPMTWRIFSTDCEGQAYRTENDATLNRSDWEDNESYRIDTRPGSTEVGW